MAYGIYLDLENLWAQNRSQLFPSFNWSNSKVWDEGLEKERLSTPAERQIIYQECGAFLDVFEAVVADVIAEPPGLKRVAAIVENLEKNPEQCDKIRAQLGVKGYHLHTPMNLPPAALKKRKLLPSVAGSSSDSGKVRKKNSMRKEASDLELILKVIDGVVFRTETDLDHVVLATGDHFGARLIGYLREHAASFKFTVVSFENSLSLATKEVIKSGGEYVNCIMLDTHPIYLKYRDRAFSRFGFSLAGFGPMDLMRYSAIYHLDQSDMPYVAPRVFKEWVRQWVSYYATTRPEMLFPTSVDIWIDRFEKEGILSAEGTHTLHGGKSRAAVVLQRNNDAVRHASIVG